MFALKLRYQFLSLIFCLLMGSAQSQTCCSAGAPITSSFDIAGSNTKTLAFRLDYEFNSVNLLVNNNERLINDPRPRNGQSIVFRSDYSLNKNWAFSAFLPFVLQNRTTFSESEMALGVGDLTLLSQYTLLGSKDRKLKWNVGIKLPTGNQYLSDSRGVNLSPDMQSGTGTIDFIARMSFQKDHVFIQNLTNQLSISYRYNTRNNHFGDREKVGGRSFKFGNETLLTSAFSYLIVARTWFVLPEFGFQLRIASANEEQKTIAPNSGGTWVNIPIGVQLKPNEQFSVRLFGAIPIYQNLIGLQITTDYRVGISFAYQLLK